MQEKISFSLLPGNPDEILTEAFGLQITRQDIATLDDFNWLNDMVINFYFNLLMERGKLKENAKVYAFNSFFYPKLMGGGHPAVKRWTKKVDLFAMNFILIPVHLGIHWCLCVVNMTKQVISYYDSMGGWNYECVEAVRNYISDESVAKGHVLNILEWKMVQECNIPLQTNSSDCGMFTCIYAEHITEEKAFAFSQEHMPYFRKKMIYEIVTKQLVR